MIEDLTEDGEVPTMNNAEMSLPALIGAMMDGFIKSFEHRELRVVEERGWVAIKHPTKETTLGGKTHLEGASIAQVTDWIENKAELYGSEA